MQREVICPSCGHNVSADNTVCTHCKKEIRLAENDFQSVAFESANDGYHSWYAQPTAYHTVYRCLNYPGSCAHCAHREDHLCRSNGKIDIRVARKEQFGTVTYKWDKGTEKYCADEKHEK